MEAGDLLQRVPLKFFVKVANHNRGNVRGKLRKSHT